MTVPVVETFVYFVSDILTTWLDSPLLKGIFLFWTVVYSILHLLLFITFTDFPVYKQDQHVILFEVLNVEVQIRLHWFTCQIRPASWHCKCEQSKTLTWPGITHQIFDVSFFHASIPQTASKVEACRVYTVCIHALCRDGTYLSKKWRSHTIYHAHETELS